MSAPGSPLTSSSTVPSPINSLLAPGFAVVALAASVGWQWGDARRLAASGEALRSVLVADSARLLTATGAAGVITTSLTSFLERRAARDSASDRPYLVVSIADNRLWYRRGGVVLFETRVATGSGKFLEKAGGGDQWKFETPRGRLVVERKDVDPAWVPPDWHYVEYAKSRDLELLRLERGMTIPAPGGGVISVVGTNVVTRMSDGLEVPFEVKEGSEIRVGNRLIVPPFGTNQRRYLGVLGANRLYLGDGYGIHGTDAPSSIGRSVSHGCIRVKNEDIETLFRIVPLGTPVYIY